MAYGSYAPQMQIIENHANGFVYMDNESNYPPTTSQHYYPPVHSIFSTINEPNTLETVQELQTPDTDTTTSQQQLPTKQINTSASKLNGNHNSYPATTVATSTFSVPTSTNV